jgi:hypothetical protein
MVCDSFFMYFERCLRLVLHRVPLSMQENTVSPILLYLTLIELHTDTGRCTRYLASSNLLSFPLPGAISLGAPAVPDACATHGPGDLLGFLKARKARLGGK